MTNRKRSLLNLSSAALGQILAIAIGFLLPKLFITNFGSEINGLLSSANEILVYLALFEAGVGAVTMQALYGPIARKEWGSINGILSATNVYYKKTGFIYLIALTMIAAVYPLFVASSLSHLTVSLLILFIGLPQVVSFFVQSKYILLLKADGRNYAITNLSSMITLSTGVAKVVLLLLGVHVLPVIAIQCLVLMVQALVLSRYVKRIYPQLSIKESPDYGAISQKNYMLVHQVSNLVFHSTDVMILTMVMGLKFVSVYSIYKLVMAQMNNIIHILQSSFDFILGQTFQTDRESYIHRIDQFESWFSSFLFALCAVIYFILYDFVRLYTSNVQDIVYADHGLVLLFVLIELLTVLRMPMQQTINYAGHFKQTLHQTVTETVLNIVISLVAVNFWGTYGVLAGTIVSQLYRSNEVIIYANKRLLKRSPWKTYRIHLLNIGVFVVVQVIFQSIFGPIITWFDLIKTGLVAGLLSVPLFIGVQAIAWKDNRKAIIYNVKDLGKLLRRYTNKQS